MKVSGLRNGRWVSAEMVRDGTELAIAEMLRGGITCFSDQYFYPEIVAEAAVDMQMRAVVATPVVDFATGWARKRRRIPAKSRRSCSRPVCRSPTDHHGICATFHVCPVG